MQKSKVTIVGAGIPGLSLALILADAGLDVTIYDKNKLPRMRDIKPSSRTAALMHGSLKILERAGIWPDAASYCTRLATLSIIDDGLYPDGVGDMIREDFNAEELGLSEFGYNVPLGIITALLVEKAGAHENITMTENVNMTQDDPIIKQADLIVGADGRNSIIRQWAGIDATTKDYNQTAITCVIVHDLPHDNTSIEFHRSGGPCTFVPHGNNQSAVVWVEKTEDANTFLNLSDDELTAALQDRTRDVLGNINVIVKPESWPLMTLKANQFIASKTALIAEAAHVLSPIGAQGMNLSLRDVGALADCVIKAQDARQDIGGFEVLKSYDRNRKRDVNPRHIGIDLFNGFVANDNAIARGLRRLGLKSIRHAGPLRKILMEQGLSPKS